MFRKLALLTGAALVLSAPAAQARDMWANDRADLIEGRSVAAPTEQNLSFGREYPQTTRVVVADPTEAAPGSIRGDLGRDWGEKVQKNIVHGSDSPESAAREIGIWFPEL